MRKFELRSDDMKIAKKNVADIWDDMKPDEKSSDVKCEGCNVLCEEGACLTLHCTGSRAGHVLGQQHCNSFAQSTHARAWLRTAHASSLVPGSDS